MPPQEQSHTPSTRRPPSLEVADIVRAHGAAFRQRHALTPEQHRVLRDIERCRTAALGGHLDVCNACGHSTPSYNSCRNRHCPKCQGLHQAKWIEQREQRILPTHYFHVVFTLPSELRTIAMYNRERVFDLLFQAASQTLLVLGRDPNRMGAQLGITAVLHTWTRELQFHPHLHCIVTGGGLSLDGDRWVSTSRRYLLPVKVLAALFRGKFLDALARAHTHDAFVLPPGMDPSHVARLRDTLYRKDWIVYAKRPFGGPEQVFRYLGRYTHRVGISNHRLVAMDEQTVTFRTKAGKTVTVTPEQFLRRFVQHVLPRGFVKIRHDGLMAAGNAKTKLEMARRLLESPPAPAQGSATDGGADRCVRAEESLNWHDRLRTLTGLDRTRCSRCGHGTMVPFPLPSSRTPDTS